MFEALVRTQLVMFQSLVTNDGHVKTLVYKILVVVHSCIISITFVDLEFSAGLFEPSGESGDA
jgi:hypothetical protein